ncbi:Sporulation sigma-E factor-processing peptidase [Sporomusa carbonis]|uniref:sigma-E processing peptidase SpoIIGA n=1 Tax=Sporomusa carbonis TaxID=3076075 RepID=UPI003A720BA5
MYVYADVIILINFIMNSIILALTAYAAGISIRWKRLLTAALAGGIYALAGIMPQLAVLYGISGKFFVSVALILLAFGRKPIKTILILVGIFFVVSFILGGAVLGWLYFAQTGTPYMSGNVGGLSWINLAAGSIMAIIIVTLVARRMFSRMYRRQILYQAKFEYEGRYSEVTGMLDTGNGLYSLLGRRPVVLLAQQAAVCLLSPQAADFLNQNSPDTWLANLDKCPDTAWLARVEVLPYQAVGSRSMLLCFRPDSITVMTEYGPVKTANVLIGIYDGVFTNGGNCQALLHPALITGVNTTKEAGTCVLPGQ